MAKMLRFRDRKREDPFDVFERTITDPSFDPNKIYEEYERLVEAAFEERLGVLAAREMARKAVRDARSQIEQMRLGGATLEEIKAAWVPLLSSVVNRELGLPPE